MGGTGFHCAILPLGAEDAVGWRVRVLVDPDESWGTEALWHRLEDDGIYLSPDGVRYVYEHHSVRSGGPAGDLSIGFLRTEEEVAGLRLAYQEQVRRGNVGPHLTFRDLRGY